MEMIIDKGYDDTITQTSEIFKAWSGKIAEESRRTITVNSCQVNMVRGKKDYFYKNVQDLSFINFNTHIIVHLPLMN